MQRNDVQRHSAPMNQRASYIARVNRVIDHIDAHLAGPLDLATLASIAHFSPWHFHRVFQALTGETLAEQVRRRRLEVAAIRLLASPPLPALTIALDVGFASAEVFTRAFKAHFGATPTAWRRGAYRDWAMRHRVRLSKIHQADRKPSQALDAAFRDDAASRQSGRDPQPKGSEMKPTNDRIDVELKTLPDTLVAYMRHTGPYGDPGISRMWQRFEAGCAQRGLLGHGHAMFGISQNSPDITAPEKCRYDACVEVDDAFRPDGEIGVQTIHGGRYACTKFHGTPDRIHAAWMRLYAEWLPDSGYQADDRPGIEAYGDALAIDKQTGAFACELCLPVRPL